MTSKPLHVCIDATSWANDRGFGRFTREIVKALLGRDEGFRYTLLFDQLPEEPLPPGAEILSARTDLRIEPVSGWQLGTLSGLFLSRWPASPRPSPTTSSSSRPSIPISRCFSGSLRRLLSRRDGRALSGASVPDQDESLAVARQDCARPFPDHSRDDRLRDVRGGSGDDSQISASDASMW